MPKNLYKNANSVIEGNYDNTPLGANTYLLGLTSLFDEMGAQGHSISDVLSGTNISPDAMNHFSLYISQVQKFSYFKIFKSYQMIHSLVCAQGKSSDCQILECMAMRYILHVILDKRSSLVFDTLSLQDLF